LAVSARAHEGLPKRYRLLRPANFQAVLRRGEQTRDRLFTVYASQNALAHMRFGLVVSRKASPKAVVRNRLKRHVREAARRHQQQLRGLDVVVVAKSAAATAAPDMLRASLERHWISIIERCKDS
jgi:ribonuclease P protein component